MAAGTVDDPWERTLALRLRSLYGATAPTQPVDAGPLLARLQRHCDALQRVGRDRYRVDASIAAGGMGRVDAAVDVVARRTVALKRAAPCADTTELARRRLRLLGEAATLAKLQHPGVVPLYDLGLLDDEPFFAMPRIDGRTLADVLAEGDADGSARPRRIELLRRFHLLGLYCLCFRGNNKATEVVKIWQVVSNACATLSALDVPLFFQLCNAALNRSWVNVQCFRDAALGRARQVVFAPPVR